MHGEDPHHHHHHHHQRLEQVTWIWTGGSVFSTWTVLPRVITAGGADFAVILACFTWRDSRWVHYNTIHRHGGHAGGIAAGLVPLAVWDRGHRHWGHLLEFYISITPCYYYVHEEEPWRLKKQITCLTVGSISSAWTIHPRVITAGGGNFAVVLTCSAGWDRIWIYCNSTHRHGGHAGGIRAGLVPLAIWWCCAYAVWKCELWQHNILISWQAQ